jgi:REP element-mobilizing transposase RayT
VAEGIIFLYPLVPKLCLGTHSPKLCFAIPYSHDRSRYRIFETEYPYCMTCTIVGWAPIFTRPETFELIYDSWRFLQRERQFQLFAYVILENHLHLIARAPVEVMRHFKSFTGRQIIDLAGTTRGFACCYNSSGLSSYGTRKRASIRFGRKEAIRSRFETTK